MPRAYVHMYTGALQRNWVLLHAIQPCKIWTIYTVPIPTNVSYGTYVYAQICIWCLSMCSLLVLQNSDGTPYAPRKPTAFAAFVQENYSSVKQSLPLGTPHKDVMRILSSNYKEKKQLNVWLLWVHFHLAFWISLFLTATPNYARTMCDIICKIQAFPMDTLD